MGGVTGYWAYASHDPAEPVFAAFTHSLAHRGPDGFGIEHFPEARFWLGHRRLAIVDRSERARQPMSYADGRFWLTYNGEIYNYIELREELRGLGHRFASNSDSEVILAAYVQWGQDCQFHFNGAWAFAIWDADVRRLFLSRDRFGVKPLHYTDHAGAFVFASELKAFLTLPWISGAFDPETLTETLIKIKSQEASPFTLLPGVRRLPAGHAMIVEADGRLRINAWWNTLDHLPQPSASIEEQADEFRALFFDACRLRLGSDVPLAIEQSGGLDSSAIAGTVAQLERGGAVRRPPEGRRTAFITCFPNSPYDESDLARIVVRHTAMLGHFESVEDHDAVDKIEQVIFDHEIIWWFPRIGSWMLYRAMRNCGFRASLNGMDADTLLGSDPDHIELALDAAAARRNRRRYWDLRRVLRGLYESSPTNERANVRREIRWFARRHLARHNLLEPLRGLRAHLRSLRLSQQYVSASISGGIPIVRPHAQKRTVSAITEDARIAAMSPLEAKHFAEFHSALQTYLANFDRSAMANGIDVRMPFMDWRLVTYCFALPETSRNGDGYTKRVLRLATKELVPDAIRLRTSKMPFVVPLDDWARGALRPWLLDLCADRSFIESPLWNGPKARTIVERATAGQGSIVPVWPILHAHVLERTFIARALGAKNVTLQKDTSQREVH